MTASVTSPADVVNIALKKAGIKGRIGSLLDGSQAAKVVLDFYAQTRDATLRASHWNFSERFMSAVASGGTPPSIWAYEFSYPSDCLKVRNLFNASYLADTTDPLPVLWQTGNNSTAQVIWTNASAPTICYTAQVTNPALWEPLFVEVLTNELAKPLALSIGLKDAVKLLMEEDKDVIPIAEGTVG